MRFLAICHGRVVGVPVRHAFQNQVKGSSYADSNPPDAVPLLKLSPSQRRGETLLGWGFRPLLGLAMSKLINFRQAEEQQLFFPAPLNAS